MTEGQSTETVDTLFGGALELLQPASGYRFSIDALLLAGVAEAARADRVLDLGCGCGVVGLAMAYLWQPAEVVGIECQAELAELARRNVERNRLETAVRVMVGDVRGFRELLEPNTFDVAVCNPPYYAASEGRINPDSQRALARHEIAGTLGDFLRAARYGLKPRGVCWVVYPAFRLEALMVALADLRIHPEWLRLVHPRQSEPATLVLCGARLGGSGRLSVRPPLVIHDDEGHTPVVAALLAGRRPPFAD